MHSLKTDPTECIDTFDGDGIGNNADSDDDGDGWTDADEIRLNTDSLSSSSQPVDSFEIVIPGTAVGLIAWDLIGIFGGVPLFAWIGIWFCNSMDVVKSMKIYLDKQFLVMN